MNNIINKRTPIKKRSYSLVRAEKERFSIIALDLDNCVICGKKKGNLHEVYFGKNRQLSMKYGCVIPLCYACHIMIHNNHNLDLIWKIKMQYAFEKEYPDLDFLEIFGKNYK